MDVTKPLFTWVATEFSGMDISKLMLTICLLDTTGGK